MDLPGNSHVSRKKLTTSDETVNKKVISGTVIQKPPSLIESVAHSFFGDTPESVGRYLVMDVLVPAMKTAISDIVSTGIEMLLFGEKRSTNNKPRQFGVVNYSDISSGRRRQREEEPAYSRTSRKWENIVLATREDAQAVLSSMADILEEYNAVTIADLYDLVGLNSDFTDQRFGWTDIGRSTVRLIREGYLLEFPNPSVLK